MSTSFTVIRPASDNGSSRRMISPSSRFKSSRTRSTRIEGMAKHSIKGLQFLRNLLQSVTLDGISHLEIIEPIQPYPAFHAGAHFVDFVLETPQREGNALVNEALAPHHTHFAFDDASAGDRAARHIPAFG